MYCNFNQIKVMLFTLIKVDEMKAKLPKVALNLKQFLLRQEVLKLYRDIQRTIRLIPDEGTRLDLITWARSDFKNNKHQTDEATIKSLINYGKKSLKDLQSNLALSKS